MINIKSNSELEAMRESGKIASFVLQEVIKKVKPGITTLELDKFVETEFEKHGATPSFKMEKGYFWSTCMCVNDCVVHGIPTDEKLVDGDKLCIDLGAYLNGWHSDTAWTVVVGKTQNKELEKFLETGKKALEKAISVCVLGNHVGDISAAMQEIIEGSGYSSVRQLVGHGVGRELHEDPEVPCYVRGKSFNTPELKEGMVLAIEVIYNMGKSPVVYKNADGWSIVTRDGLPSAVFEHTVAVTKGGPRILTA